MKNKKNFFSSIVKGVGSLAMSIVILTSFYSFKSEKSFTVGPGIDNELFGFYTYYVPQTGERGVISKGQIEFTNVDKVIVGGMPEYGCPIPDHPAVPKNTIEVQFKPQIFTKPETVFALAPLVRKKAITMIDLKYPYGKPKIYLSGSTIVASSRFLHLGYDVHNIDLNIDEWDDSLIQTMIKNSDFVGVSLIGAPYIPSAIELVKKLDSTHTPVLLGGQVVEKLSTEQFNSLFKNTNAKQIVNDADLVNVLGCTLGELKSPYSLIFSPVLENLGDERLKVYMSREMTMVLSQGCHFQCAFCAAAKSQRETFRSFEVFSGDMRFLAKKAKKFGLKKLEFYASSLDFFQTPNTIVRYLEELALIQKEYGVQFRIRGLSCMTSFLKTADYVGEDKLNILLKNSGVWCIGFGVDGSDQTVWKAQKKRQNSLSDIKDCLDMTQRMGVRAEILMVMGFPEDTKETLKKNIKDSFRYVYHWNHTILRPYLAKQYVPGNDGWKSGDKQIEAFMQNPQYFFNLDFCAIGSEVTHPNKKHRVWSNFCYLFIIGAFTSFGKCVTSPLLPQGNSGFYGWISKIINRIMPFDR